MSLTIRQALDILSVTYPRILAEGFGSRFADEVISQMWVRYPFKQTLAKLPPFHPVAYEPDYGPPLSAVPTDFFALHDAWLKNCYHYERPLSILKDLRPSSWPGEPEAIAYIPEIPGFRLHPRPNLNPPYWWVEGRYKKKPTLITDATINSTAFPFDDVYFHVFRQGMHWKYEQEVSKSPRAPEHFALFMNALRGMAISEGIHQGAAVRAPECSLSLGG